MATSYVRRREQLGEQLKALRQQATLSGNRLAKQLGWPQSKVSRIETGKQLAAADDVRAWTRAVGAPGEAVRELLALQGTAAAEYATWQEQYRAMGSAAAKQDDILRLEQAATTIAEFQPAMIPGLLQTFAYACEVLRLPCGPSAWGESEEGIAAMVERRMRRQQVLYQPGKRIRHVLLEGALHTRLVSAETLSGQLRRLIDAIDLPTEEFGIIPFTAPVPVWPIGSFALVDDDLAITESLAGEQRISRPDEVAYYNRCFDQLFEASSTGVEAVVIIRRALADSAL